MSLDVVPKSPAGKTFDKCLTCSHLPAGDAPSPLKLEGDENHLSFSGLVTNNPMAPGDRGAFVAIFEFAGLSQDDYRLRDGSLKFGTWQQSARAKDGHRDLIQLYSYSGQFDRIKPLDLEADDAADLLRLAQRPRRRPKHASKRVRVVIMSDAQIGKVNSRGGTPELLARSKSLFHRLDQIMEEEPCGSALVLDPGDLIEGFENVKGQRFTNDLSLPSMLRVGRALLTDLIGTVAARHASTQVATVPSNHGAWREGEGYLGTPGDDFGIDCHHAVSEAFANLPKLGVSWLWPEKWSPSVAIDAGGARIGLTHGDKARKGKFREWLAGQTLGSTVLADCNIIISGHFHTFMVTGCGWLGKRERRHIQSPTMDNGSEWWRSLTGDDSAPGIVTFILLDGEITHLRLIEHTV